MSFEQNDIIHIDNYQEFFILYMDNELNEEQRQLVDAFLITHPDLQAEFDLLMSTKLPVEEFCFDKDALLAHKMKVATVDEELLLYMDNELPPGQRNIIKSELAANKSYQIRYQLLLQTKLDSSEQILYPDKKELYRHTKKIIAFKPWLRVASAVAVIAVATMLYFENSSSHSVQDGSPKVAITIKKPKNQPEKNNNETIVPVRKDKVIVITPKENTAETYTVKTENKNTITPQKSQDVLVATNSHEEDNNPQVKKITTVDFNRERSLALNEPKVSINNPDVTSSLLERTTNSITVASVDELQPNRKGSFRGFLRKATRVIEKRTGIDPANENGELLIGAVAISLK